MSDERVRAAVDAVQERLREMLEAAGPGHALGYRVKPEPFWRADIMHGEPFRDKIEYETHLVALEADGSLAEGLAGFHYVTLRK